MSKAAVHHLTKKLADEFGGTRPGKLSITVNAIAPGYVPSKMSAQLDAYTGDAHAVVERIPLGRLGAPADMAGAALFLSSPAGAWITGVVLPVDGGFLAKL
jgi:NAD(P)-dependent dehydrogenase (short-subunit alcohol dehydrogenase family)